MSFTSNIHTLYSNLSNEELLNELDSIRHLSPIIQELCTRLDSYDYADYRDSMKPATINQHGPCPVCRAELTLQISDNGENIDIQPT